MSHAVYALVKRYYKVYISDEEADGKSEAEIEELARQKIKDEELNALTEDDTPFEPENDVLELWYGYEFPDF
jgi:hypothetical protein